MNDPATMLTWATSNFLALFPSGLEFTTALASETEYQQQQQQNSEHGGDVLKRQYIQDGSSIPQTKRQIVFKLKEVEIKPSKYELVDTGQFSYYRWKFE